jgi:hypothetical protein
VHWSLAGPMNNFAASSSCSCQNSLLSPKGRKSASSDRLSSADHRLLVNCLATKRCLTRTDHFPVPCCNLNSGMQPLLCPPGQEAARPPGGAQLGPLDITTCDGNTLKLSYLFRQPARLSRPRFWEYKALEDSVTRSGFGTGPVSPDESATKMPTTLQSHTKSYERRHRWGLTRSLDSGGALAGKARSPPRSRGVMLLMAAHPGCQSSQTRSSHRPPTRLDFRLRLHVYQVRCLSVAVSADSHGGIRAKSAPSGVTQSRRS